MAIRGWQKGLFKASQWAVKLAREGLQVPIPQSLLDRLVRRVDDPSVRDLKLEARTDDRVQLSGLKKKGVWVSFSATFRLAAPRPDDPAQSLALHLQEAEPFFARSAVLTALGDIDGVRVDGERVLVDLGEYIRQHQWGGKIPAAVRERLRITDVHSSDGRIQLRVGLA